MNSHFAFVSFSQAEVDTLVSGLNKLIESYEDDYIECSEVYALRDYLQGQEFTFAPDIEFHLDFLLKKRGIFEEGMN